MTPQPEVHVPTSPIHTPCQHDHKHTGLTATLATITITLWLGVIGLLVADLDGTMPGIVVGLVAIVGAVTALATVQVWILDHSGRYAEPVATRHRIYESADGENAGDAIRRAPSTVARARIDEDTARIPTQTVGMGITPVEAGKLYRLLRLSAQPKILP